MVYECGNIEVVTPTGPIMSPDSDMKLVSCSAPSRVDAGTEFAVDFTVQYVGTEWRARFGFGASINDTISDPTENSWFTVPDQAGPDQIDFSVTLTAPSLAGVYDVEVFPYRNFFSTQPLTGSSVFCTSVEVVQTFDSANVYIEDCSTSADIGVATVDEITASASIRNDKAVAAEVPAEFTGGSLDDTVRRLISPSSTTEVSSSFVFPTDGEKTIEVEIDSAAPTDGSVT